MRPCVRCVSWRWACCSATPSLHAADALSDARRLYNLGQYEAAERAAREAARVPASADAARVVLGRIQLERYRRTPDRRGSRQVASRRSRASMPAGSSRANGSSSRSVSARRYISRIDSAPPPRCSSRSSMRRSRSGRLRTSACSTGGQRRSIGSAQLRPPAERRRDVRADLERMASEIVAGRRDRRRGLLAGRLGARRWRSRARAERSDRRMGPRGARARPRRGAARRPRSAGRARRSCPSAPPASPCAIVRRRSPGWSANGRRSRRAGRGESSLGLSDPIAADRDRSR